MARNWRRHLPRLRAGLSFALRGPRRIRVIDRALHATIDYFIDCRTVRAHLSDAYDEQLPAWQTRLVRAHVASCATCGPVDRSMRSTIELLRDI
jgi:hypothetical protein